MLNSTIEVKPDGIGTFWHGSELSCLERACLSSMMEQGHRVTLFTHDTSLNVPDGVLVSDAKEITGGLINDFMRHSKGQRITTFSDLFRYHMLYLTDLIWADLDTFLLRPLIAADGYLFAHQDERRIANGVLKLPKDSTALQYLITFVQDQFPIPPFYSMRKRTKLFVRKALGFPRHVSSLSWGVFGPDALTYFLQKTHEARYAFSTESLYPIHWRDTDLFLLPDALVYEQYLRNSRAVHLYGSNTRKILQQHNHLPPDSFLFNLLKKGQP